MAERSPIRISVKKENGVSVVAPEGEIGYQEAPEFRTQLRSAFDAGSKRVIADLSGVTYMSTPGVATLVEALQMSKKNGVPLVLCGLSERVRAIFEIARLHTVFRIVGTLNEAAG